MITAQSHPKLFAALLLLKQDMGGVNRLEPAPVRIPIPLLAEAYVVLAERGLSTLSPGDFEDLVIGEMDDAVRISLRSQALTAAHTLLNIYFEWDGW